MLIMIIINGLHLKEMKHNLLSPFIMPLYGLELNEQSKFMKRNSTTNQYSIYIKDNDIRLPLAIKGIVSFLLTRK